jgi:hypothetical protein
VADYKLSSYAWWDPTPGATAGGAAAAAAAAAEAALLEAEKEMRETQNMYEEVSLSLRKLQEKEEEEGREEGREAPTSGGGEGWWKRRKSNSTAAAAAAVVKKKKQELVEKLEGEAKEARGRLLAAAARLSKVEEHAKGLSQKGRVHQRVADRLLELCQLNLGCCK